MAHGYFLVGPEVVFGALRDYPGGANLAGLVTALVLVLLGTAGIAAHGLVRFPETSPPETDPLQTAQGWSELAAGFFIGGMGGAFVAYFLLENLEGIDAIFRGFVN